MIVAALIAAFFILLPLGVLGFEMLRFSIAQMQLRSVCDAAALSGAAAIASTRSTWTPQQAQEEAMKAAFITFKQNNIFGDSLATGTTVNYNPTAPLGTPNPGQCIVNFTLLDQTFQRVEIGDPAAKLIRCESSFGYKPPIGGALGFNNIPVIAFAEGGLPQLDIILCYDISGSMDDQTRVSFVKRSWDTDKVKYEVVSQLRTSPTSLPPSCIYNMQGPPISGTRVNAIGPQNLSYADYSKAALYANGNEYAYQFSPALRGGTGTSEVGAPPGNKTDPNIPVGGATTFTDIVVNINGLNTFSKTTIDGLNFENIGAVVEAARGNLATAKTFDDASPNHEASIPNVSADANYKAVYDARAASLLQPMFAAKLAANNFYHTMNISANCHFAFVAFSDGIGTNADSLWSEQTGTTNKITDPGYTAGGEGNFPLPVIDLVQTAATTNFEEVKAAVNKLVSTGKTDIASALNKAISQLTVSNNLTRLKARRAIVLFTDGIPNLPGGDAGGENSPAAEEAYKSADAAALKNIPIYCIGLSQNSEIQGVQDKILKKIAKKTKAKYYQVSKPEDLDTAFQTIAKSLVVLR